MARDPRRTPITGSAFIRSLAALNDARAPASQDDFAQRVTQWFGWKHTFALSAALSDAPGPVTDAGVSGRPAVGTDEGEYTLVRTALVKLVSDMPPVDAEVAADFTTYRRRYLTCQQAMESQIGPLRRRLRASLAAGSPSQAQLAKLDSVMEEVVGTQERVLLATVPGLLQPRFDQLRRAHERPVAADMPHEPSQPGLWLSIFRQDMRTLLLAELDLRLQPVEGLLAASRSPSSDRHE